MMSEKRVKRCAKRMQKILDMIGIDLRYTACLELAAQLHGFDDWHHFLERDLDAPLSLLDEDLAEADFAARDAFQMAVLQAAGLGEVARELLDRANPTGSWALQTVTTASPVAIGGNDQGRWSEDRQSSDG
ncbi:hypothetical protein IVA79_26825 [Bradyrhizobium sp. 138]|nr:hypothetical protein [Bradyrhizobium sp. 138]